MVRKIISFCLMLFGLIGVFLEIGSYSEEGAFDFFGLVLAFFFILIGLLVFLWPRIKIFAVQRKSTGNSSKTPGEKVDSWGRSFLIVAGIIELIIGIPVLIFIFVLGLHGIIAGEMGTMIGFFSLSILIILFPYIFLKILVVYGLVKTRIWSIYFVLVFGGLSIIIAILIAFSLHILSIVLFVYAGGTIWAGIKCLKSPVFKTG